MFNSNFKYIYNLKNVKHRVIELWEEVYKSITYKISTHFSHLLLNQGDKNNSEEYEKCQHFK